MRQDSLQTAQLGFDDLLAEAEATNQAAAFDRATGHLPEKWRRPSRPSAI